MPKVSTSTCLFPTSRSASDWVPLPSASRIKIPQAPNKINPHAANKKKLKFIIPQPFTYFNSDRIVVSFRLIEDVLQYDFRVMIPRVLNGVFPILNRFLRAPLEASQALLTSVKP